MQRPYPLSPEPRRPSRSLQNEASRTSGCGLVRVSGIMVLGLLRPVRLGLMQGFRVYGLLGSATKLSGASEDHGR